jgi:hypothetical protein
MNRAAVKSDFEYECLARSMDVRASVNSTSNDVSFTSAQLMEYTSKLMLRGIESFIRLQRMAGVATVHWAKETEVGFLAERCVEHTIVGSFDQDALLRMLQESIVDVRPIASEALRSVCNREMSAQDAISKLSDCHKNIS